MSGELEGTFVVVLAHGDGGTEAARLAEELRGHGGRVVVFAAEGEAGETEAVLELVAELARASK
jgi:fructoselysine-6-P-deglycase FrlB-like protein